MKKKTYQAKAFPKPYKKPFPYHAIARVFTALMISISRYACNGRGNPLLLPTADKILIVKQNHPISKKRQLYGQLQFFTPNTQNKAEFSGEEECRFIATKTLT